MLLFLVMAPALMGMGSMGGSGTPDKIPLPAKKFTALVIDQLDVDTEIREISIEGRTFLEGKKGEGTFTIAFEKIKTITFLMKDGKLYGAVLLQDGNTEQLSLNKGQKIFGRTPYGTFQITLGEMKRTTFTGYGK